MKIQSVILVFTAFILPVCFLGCAGTAQKDDLAVSASEGNAPKGLRKFMKKTEKKFKLKRIMERIENGEIDSRKLQIIYLTLRNTPEYFIHNLNGASGNKVFVHKDGHKEFVYDKTGKLVQDGTNDGSYNYYGPKEMPLKHFSFDIHPWIVYGNSRRDRTSKKERIYGYVRDLEFGIRKALEQKEMQDGIQKDGWDKEGQIQALAIFILAQEKMKSDALFVLFEKQNVKDNEIYEALHDIERGFNAVY